MTTVAKEQGTQVSGAAGDDAGRASAPAFCALRVSDGSSERRVRITADEFAIGRSTSCELRLPDESVSRRHAQIVRQDGHWWIEDLGSKNGVKLNTVPVTREPLHNGDVIELGPFAS